MIFCIAFVIRKNKIKGYGISQGLRGLCSLLLILIHHKPICQLCLFGNFFCFDFVHRNEGCFVCSNQPFNAGEHRSRVIGWQ